MNNQNNRLINVCEPTKTLRLRDHLTRDYAIYDIFSRPRWCDIFISTSCHRLLTESAISQLTLVVVRCMLSTSFAFHFFFKYFLHTTTKRGIELSLYCVHWIMGRVNITMEKITCFTTATRRNWKQLNGSSEKIVKSLSSSLKLRPRDDIRLSSSKLSQYVLAAGGLCRVESKHVVLALVVQSVFLHL